MRVAARGAGAANGTCKGHSAPAPAPSAPRKVSRAYVTPDKLLSSQPFVRALPAPPDPRTPPAAEPLIYRKNCLCAANISVTNDEVRIQTLQFSETSDTAALLLRDSCRSNGVRLCNSNFGLFCCFLIVCVGDSAIN